MQASIAYLATVLGVESFLAPPGSPTEIPLPRGFVSEGPAESRLVFVATADELRGSNSELLSKMIHAMKVDPASVLRVGLVGNAPCEELFAHLGGHDRSAVVILGSAAAKCVSGEEESWVMARWLEPRAGIPVLITHSLAEIAGNNELKRLVWQHLQMVMKRL